MSKSSASQSSIVMQSVGGCTLDETIERLKYMGWTVSAPGMVSKRILTFTATTADRRMVLYAKDGRIVSANFGKRKIGARIINVPPAKPKDS